MKENKTSFEYRALERDGICRDCDKVIKRGEYCITGYSHRNRGMSMLFHLDCVKNIASLIDENENTVH